MEVTIVERVARPTGCPPRCRQCGGTCHAAEVSRYGGAVDWLCRDCHNAAPYPDHRRQALSVVAWALGRPFVVPALTGADR